MKRVLLDILIALSLLPLFYFEAYTLLPNPLQLVCLKILIVSMAILHAHIVGKLLFGRVDWTNPLNPKHIVRMVIYAIIPICYSISG